MILASVRYNFTGKIRWQTFDVNITEAFDPNSESSEDGIDTFYSGIDNALKLCRHSEINIVVGDCNAKSGNQQDENTRET